MRKFSLNAIQKALIDFKLDGWLFYDFMGSDPISRSILGIRLDKNDNKGWYYFIPAQGAPIKLVHGIESKIFDHLPGKKEVYIGRMEMIGKLKSLFKPGQKIALQYSPNSAIPTISKIDAGTFELLKSFKLDLVSSGDLIQQFDARLSKNQINTHINVGNELDDVLKRALQHIKRKVKQHQEITELSLQKFLKNQIKSCGFTSTIEPVVATGVNTANPHYIPEETRDNPIHVRRLVQLTFCAKEKNDEAVYSSLSWVAYVGDAIPADYQINFQILRDCRDKTVEFITQALKQNKNIRGWETDAFALKFIEEKGLIGNFLHRSGHSLGTSFFAHGVNIDNLETRDDRRIIPGLCLSISPGIYFADYGMKTEINVYTENKGVRVSTKTIQNQIYHIKI